MAKTQRSLPDGFYVRYTHFRRGVVRGRAGMDGFRPAPAFDRPVYGTLHELREAGAEVEPKGGETFAVLFGPDGEAVMTGTAMCRDDEVFSKAFGRHISLQRALKGLEEAAYRIAVSMGSA
jgi:hypothetical protein